MNAVSVVKSIFYRRNTINGFPDVHGRTSTHLPLPVRMLFGQKRIWLKKLKAEFQTRRVPELIDTEHKGQRGGSRQAHQRQGSTGA